MDSIVFGIYETCTILSRQDSQLGIFDRLTPSVSLRASSYDNNYNNNMTKRKIRKRIQNWLSMFAILANLVHAVDITLAQTVKQNC